MTTPFSSTVPSRFWADLTSEAFSRLDRPSVIAVLPVGAIEQHGPHLPMSVDTATVNAMVAATLPHLSDDLPVLFLPTQPVGKSNEHSRYPGTLTLSAQTLITLWSEIGACVAAAGVRKLVLFNSHGGQESVMDIVARDLRERFDMLVVCVNWYQLGLPDGLIGDDEMRHGIHAGELESSILLEIHPELVHMDRAKNFNSTDRALSEGSRYLSYVEGKARVAWQTQDLNPQGACGNATLATAQKGRATLDYVGEQFARVLEDIHRVPLESLDSATAW